MFALRFRALDGWRGVCALLVAAYHIESHGYPYGQALVSNAWLFVDLFFVLSGFVIAHAYGGKLATVAELKAFMLRRLGRLWPLHVAVLTALVALELAHLAVGHWHPIAGAHATFVDDRVPIAILSNLFLVQSLGLHHTLTWNTPSWSVSTEFYTYLVFAAVCFFAQTRRTRLALFILLSLLGVALLAGFSHEGMRETFDWGMARCLYGFFLGVLTYEVWKSGAAKVVGGTFAEAVVVVASVAFVSYVPDNWALEFWATPLFALAVLAFADARGLISRLMVGRAAASLGRWSYSIYMVHMLVIDVLFSAIHVLELVLRQHWLARAPDNRPLLDLGSALADDLLILAFLGAVIALSALTWRYIEQPGQRVFNRLARVGAAEVTVQTP